MKRFGTKYNGPVPFLRAVNEHSNIKLVVGWKVARLVIFLRVNGLKKIVVSY